jgi:hypothetical protein
MEQIVAIKLPSNLHRNRFGILYFRISIPKDLQLYFATKVIYRSLHTSSIRLATDAAHPLVLHARHLFNELRNQPMSETKKTSLEVWSDFQNLPDIRERLKLAGLQVTTDQQAAELEQREQLIANLEAEQTKTNKQHENALESPDFGASSA